MPLFQTFPEYQCLDPETNEWYECLRGDFCGNPAMTWQINWESEFSMNNMIVGLDQHCITPFNLGLVGGSYFIGFILGSQILSGKADEYGRIGTFKRFYPLSILGTLILYFSNSMLVLYLGIVIYGFSSILRTSIALVYAGECGEKKYTSKINFFAQFIKLILTLVIIMLIWKVSSYWRAYYFYVTILQVIPWLLSFFFPESPKQLFSLKKYDQLERSLATIFKVNSMTNKALT
eukprot:CAMPEP_0170564384 /NCGR_PEP_ID=MMETSP0211-20121228/72594_1 /TAXON_ID=311385 /ORGANISM="Pseudokeronopsis sp., Strain OXSARD2" /LENGTH=233 /DNA_ID=CAMNT_0010883777 /DNA_START=151 /DNA_END=852 /DNA_ORIENTATION=-